MVRASRIQEGCIGAIVERIMNKGGNSVLKNGDKKYWSNIEAVADCVMDEYVLTTLELLASNVENAMYAAESITENIEFRCFS